MDESEICCTGITDTEIELNRKLDEANRRIAELESRTLTVTLPEPFDFYIYNGIQIKVLHYGLTVERLRAAGIRVSGGEPSSYPTIPDQCRCHNETGKCNHCQCLADIANGIEPTGMHWLTEPCTEIKGIKN